MKHQSLSNRVRTEELESLPEGVSIADWALERQRWQNPRIRTLLGCITLISGVFESNFAILHCSPDRLMDIWERVAEVAKMMLEQLTPLLAVGSVIDELDTELTKARGGLAVLTGTVLCRLDASSAEGESRDLMEIRKLLCVAIGQTHGYLQDSFGRIMAADPRSLHDADYYLSHRFPRDIEEAEWLHATVRRLKRYLANSIEPGRRVKIEPFAVGLYEKKLIVTMAPWPEVLLFLGEITQGLVPKLKEVLALRGIRFAEMEVLDRYTEEIPSCCKAIIELHSLRIDFDQDHGAAAVNAEIGVRIGRLLTDINGYLKDLHSFVPLWLTNIEERRALLLKRS